MQNFPEYNIIRLTESDYLDTIVDLHRDAFKNVLSGQIGRRFLRYYYKTVLKNDVIYACFLGTELAGFISGTENEKRLTTGRYYLHAVTGVLSNFYHPCLYLSLCRHIKRLKAFDDAGIKSELLSVVVHPDYRGKGIGVSLVNELEKYFEEKKVGIYKVYTDTLYSTGYKLYEKLGFVLFKEVNLYGLPFRMYTKTIKLN
ncbi:MAG: GNAT family N-acetyltransferase [Bacteroidales bacterium]|nr:GNAT family N-acetyltransferase [Bacteroidales bacterium]